MKKIMLLSGVFYALASFPASAQIIIQFPQGRDWHRQQSDRQYWERVRMNREAREHAREESHDHGKHYGYGKNQKHYKEGWRDGRDYRGEHYNNDSRNHNDNHR